MENKLKKEIDYFGFDAFILAEDLHDIMPSLRAKYGHLAREAKEKNNLELHKNYSEKRANIHLVYESLQINKDSAFVKAELEKYASELKILRM